MTHCSTHHAFPVPLSSSPAARAVCCPPGRAQSPSSSSCTTRPRAGRSHAPRLVHLPSPLPVTQRLQVLFRAGRDGQHSPSVVPREWGPRKVGSQPSPLPAVGFRGQDGGQLQLHTAQIHTKKSNEAPRISHSHSCTSSPPRTAPAEHPAPTPYPPLPQFPLSDPFTCPATVGGDTQGCHQDLGDRTATAVLLGILISQPQTRPQNHSSTKKRGRGVGAQDRGGSPRASQAAPGQGEHNKPRGLPKIPILRC